MFLVLFALSGCAGRSESMVYTPQTLPPWIVEEWENAQDELLELPGIELYGDPRSISPHRFHWVQLETPFYHNVKRGQKRELLNGVYDHTSGKREIIVCCGYKKTVRHEAAHAILHQLGDPRYKVHYPELKEMFE